ncbi:MAG: putative nucleotidyltransferase substrate binding domain-containing protein, partial [Pseudomonadota bacterium]
ASVMFDLRAIGPDGDLLDDLRADTLARAKQNSIFIAHMVANSLKHQPPLGLFRGFALIRSGEHKNRLDLKHSGVVPVVDLGRLYALMGGLTAIGTRPRLLAAREAGLISEDGGNALIDAYDLIADRRLAHQAAQVRRAEKPDNFMLPATLSDLERSHLRDAFIVIKTMQAAAAQGRHTVV